MQRGSGSTSAVSVVDISDDTGDRRARILAARNSLVEQHLHLIPPIANRVHQRLPPSFDIDDLISEGKVGLIGAATRYCPQYHNGTPFSAFARPRIHGAIVDSVRRRAWTENTAFPLEDAPEPAHSPDTPYLIRPRRETRRRGASRRTGAFQPEALPKPLARALGRLPARQRAILGAFYGEGGSHSQIAVLVNLSVDQVASEHQAALDSLHGALMRNLSCVGSTLIYFSGERRAA